MLDYVTNFLLNNAPSIGEPLAILIARAVLVVFTVILALLSLAITTAIAKKAVVSFVRKTPAKWDEVLAEKGFFTRLCYLAPALVVHSMIAVIFAGADTTITVLTAIIHIYVWVVIVFVVYSLLNWVVELYHRADRKEKMPIRGFVQALKLIVFSIVTIIILSIILGKSPIGLLSGLGALTAILMLIFKDSILGFVAGIQMNVNNMVSIGDWIEMPKYGADGDVIDVSLTTVKVQNWDKTITTIPAYAMISDSFKNWRGMSLSGGRRIMRSVYIDTSSIKFCDEEMLDKFRKIHYISDYIDQKKQQISKHNQENKIDDSVIVNGRHLTNIGTFRAYLVAYLRNHPQINNDMTFLVRQLESTAQGLPLQIYVFCKDKVWANYESIQADIFDHILAVAPQFELKVFQNPSGSDIRDMIQIFKKA